MNIPKDLKEKIKSYHILIHKSIQDNIYKDVIPGELFGNKDKAKSAHNKVFDYTSLMTLLSIVYMDKKSGGLSNLDYYKKYKIHCVFRNLNCSVENKKEILKNFDLLPENFLYL